MTTQNETTIPSLYQRLGGADGIASLVDDLVVAHMENPVIKARFLPFRDKPERLAAIKEHTCAFLTMGSGGPGAYAGRSMLEAHRGMNVSAAEYVAAVDDILATLQKHDKDEQTQNDVLAMAYSLKNDIVNQ